ncbi:MAG TPA: 4'-phosphopantetheinyl transferase superfamily protein [Bryobacteraceae bacterium]|nr:4'-phosphopantetheinyl transferase superfamily protein [Bryobacteraceae bacterium]
MRQLELNAREVQLWAARLEASDDTLGRISAWLSSDETDRAARFRFEKHRRAFVLGRGVLRALAANYLQIDPAEVRFIYGPKGKPTLAGSGCPLRFNVSNSGDVAVYGFTLDCEIGVDVEHRRRPVEIENIARRFFAPGEVAELMSLPEDDRHQGFFNCWTRKEAYIKAVGDGLSVPLDSFEVTLEPGAAPRMVRLEGSTAAAEHWTLHAFTPGPEYTGAIAYRDRPRPLNIQPLQAVVDLLT